VTAVMIQQQQQSGPWSTCSWDPTKSEV